jgi:hypothetical protein
MVNELNITKQVELIIRNKLVKDRRDVNVYHHISRSSHILSCNSSLTRSIRTVEEMDFLQISVVTGPGHLKDYCVLELPSFLDFRFSLVGEAILIHSGEWTLLRIPPGPPTWEIKMTIPRRLSMRDSLNDHCITLSDDGEWPEDKLRGILTRDLIDKED